MVFARHLIFCYYSIISVTSFPQAFYYVSFVISDEQVQPTKQDYNVTN